MRVEFTHSVTITKADGTEQSVNAGEVVELREDAAARWMRRGVAKEAAAVARPAAVVQTKTAKPARKRAPKER